MPLFHVTPADLVGTTLANLARETRIPYLRLWRAANGGERFDPKDRRRIADVISKHRSKVLHDMGAA